MGHRRLKLARPVMRPAVSRVMQITGEDRYTVSGKVHLWRAWYKTAEWRALRKAVLLRDLWTCQQTGVLLVTGRDKPNSAVVDHIRPHRGDRALFFDMGNLQAVSKAWHDSEKQRQERTGEA